MDELVPRFALHTAGALEQQKAVTMVDTVAAAIRDYDGCGLNINGRRAFCDDAEAADEIRVTDPACCICRGMARKAIAAMRDLPDWLAEVGRIAITTAYVEGECPSYQDAHETMIDAALEAK